jgi:hypothetical protein
MPRLAESGYCRMSLRPDPAAAAALDRILGAHARLLDWLDASIPAGSRADLVALHRNFYEPARAVSGLPARSVTLAFRDWVRRRRGDPVDGLPLDQKLYSIKGIETVSVATLTGRVTVPFRVEDYGAGWSDAAPARLVREPTGFVLLVSTDGGGAANSGVEEDRMLATESPLKRIGRVIAGMANLAIDAAEGASPEAVLTQSIREIDGAADEVRTDLGKATAERHRLDLRRRQLLAEKAALDAQVLAALDSGRDDLAEAGIARQIDIEAQVGVLDRLLTEVAEKVAQLGQTLDAVAASRREAEQALKDFKASQIRDAHGGVRDAALAKIVRAQAAASRVTGVPAPSASADVQALTELADLVRVNEVKARLAQLKSERNS